MNELKIEGVFVDLKGRWYEVRARRRDGQAVVLHDEEAATVQRQHNSRPPAGAFVSAVQSMSDLKGRRGPDTRMWDPS